MNDDLDLGVELINTVYLLADPPDRLTTTEYFRALLRRGDEIQLAAELADTDLDRLRTLREQLRPLFECEDRARATALANAMLSEYAAVPQLSQDGDGSVRIRPAGHARGFDALAARIVAAVAEHLVAHGIRRLGVCAAAPCDCVFVDRTRPGTRKYCCDGCNDRAAAAAHYRRRQTNRPADE
ncbi:CGNR zinc finger domain-containing protein [Nocardia sp. NPDC046763]|uniref:CGNR zinc finger domain-containing protein n=1 Tax=Nocardia sp. NPDC046763 TaxID=3155256 RepID=UPI0033D34F23